MRVNGFSESKKKEAIQRFGRGESFPYIAARLNVTVEELRGYFAKSVTLGDYGLRYTARQEEKTRRSGGTWGRIL